MDVVKQKVPNEASEHTEELPQPSSSDVDQHTEAIDADIAEETVDARDSEDDEPQETDNEMPVDSRPFKCRYCPYRASKMKDLKAHGRTHAGEKRFKCRHYPYRAAHKFSLVTHEKIHTGEKPFKCQHCPFRTGQKHTLEDHERTHTGERPFKCTHCSYASRTKLDLRKHSEAKHSGGRKPYACDECDFRTAHAVSLRRHKRIHSGEKPYECAICGERFRFYSNVKTHMASRHDSEEGKKYACPECDFRTAFSESLARHRRTHTGEKPYNGAGCAKRSPAASRQCGTLQEHMRRHTGEKPYKCQDCDKPFTSSSALASHVKTHTGEKPYACDFCNHRSTTKWNLGRHMEAMHEGVEPFKRDRRDERFRQRQQLDNHIRKHGGEGSLKCDKCDATFRLKQHLISHRKFRHNAK